MQARCVLWVHCTSQTAHRHSWYGNIVWLQSHCKAKLQMKDMILREFLVCLNWTFVKCDQKYNREQYGFLKFFLIAYCPYVMKHQLLKSIVLFFMIFKLLDILDYVESALKLAWVITNVLRLLMFNEETMRLTYINEVFGPYLFFNVLPQTLMCLHAFCILFQNTSSTCMYSYPWL